MIDTHIRPKWEAVPIVQVGDADIQAWVADLVASGMSGAHVRKVSGVMSGILGLAVRDRRIPASPAALAVYLLAYCGLRWSELAALPRQAD